MPRKKQLVPQAIKQEPFLKEIKQLVEKGKKSGKLDQRDVFAVIRRHQLY
jgi:hypothetical protein